MAGALPALFLALAALPSWWEALPRVTRLEADFVQSSDSAVFGRLQREGHLKVARGGLLKVEYRHGPSLQSDGRTLVQYDPEARTAQRMELRTALADMPLLHVLLDPSALSRSYEVLGGPGGTVLLRPRRKDLPEVAVSGEGGLIRSVSWTDATGARQVLELRRASSPGSFPADAFRIRVPEGTRWIGFR